MPGGGSIPIAIATTSASEVVAQAGVTSLPEDSGSKIPSISGVAGWTINETAGAAAHFRLYDGTSASGIEVADVQLAANGNSSPSLSEPIQVSSGAIFLQVVSGSVAGVVEINL